MSSNEILRELRCIFRQSLNFFALGACLGSFTGFLCAADAPDVKPTPAEEQQAPAVNSPDSDKALKILTQSNETMAKFKTFKAEILNTDETSKTKSKTILYQRNNPDGVMEIRMDFENEIGGVKRLSTDITNREGQWELTPTTAIKMDYKEGFATMAQQTVASMKKEGQKSGSYSLSETEIDGKSFWIVKEAVDAATSQNLQESLQEMIRDNPQMKELLKTASLKSIPSLPQVTLYRIGKADGILYSTQQFDSKGNKISDVTYENVEANLPLAADFFSVPKNLKVKVAKTINDYIALKTK